MKKLCVLFLCALLCLSGCANQDEVRDNDGVVVGDVADETVLTLQMRPPDTLNPLLTTKQSVQDALFTIYEPLIKIDDNFQPQCCLAESYTLSEDCLSLTVKLKQGILWHNKTLLSAQDVVYSVNTVLNSSQSPYRAQLSAVSTVLATDASTVVFSLSRPDAQLVYALYFPIIPASVADLDATPVGTGPYIVSEYAASQYLMLEDFELWHGGGALLPAVRIAMMRDDETATSAFTNGVLHAVTGNVLDLNNYNIRPETQTVSYVTSGEFEFIAFNHDNALFATPSTRRAISAAIDRDALIREVYGAGAVSANVPIPMQAASVSVPATTTAFNIESALELLFFDGWGDTSDRGVLSRSDGSTLSFSLLVNEENETRCRAANMVASALEAIGVRATVEYLSWEDYTARIQDGDYDAFLGGTQIGTPYDLHFLLASDGNLNLMNYQSDYMDLALSRMASSPTEESLRTAGEQFLEVFEREQPLAGLCFPGRALITSATVGGDPQPRPYSPYDTIHRWFLKK